MGEIDQKPPVFSAIKIDGNRAYDLARAGKDVEMKSRKTTIHYIKNVEVNLPLVVLQWGCSKELTSEVWLTTIGQSYGCWCLSPRSSEELKRESTV